MSNDIAANRISCKPQKLQEMLATAKIGRGSWTAGSAGGPRLAERGPGPAWLARTRVIDSVLLSGLRDMKNRSPKP